VLFETFDKQLARLPGNTRLFPGHDYIETNLKFTLSREPDNLAAQAMLQAVTGHTGAEAPVTTLLQEKQHNTFFRLDQAGLIAKLRESVPDLPQNPDAQAVFVALRTLRNQW
jgi:hydroxyacylglutathione hydrolase